jgi:hypothetical protein
LIILLKRQTCGVYFCNFSNIICTNVYWGTMHLHLPVHGNWNNDGRAGTKNLISVNYSVIYRSPLVSKLLKYFLRAVLYMTVIRTRLLHLAKHLTLCNSCYGPIIQTSNNKGIMHMEDDCLNQLHTVLHAYIESLYHISNVAVMNILILEAEWEHLKF